MSKKIAIRKPTLPATIKELQKFILVGQEQLKAYQAKLRAIDKAGFAKQVRDQTLGDTQLLGTALLWAEAKLGELLKGIPKRPITESSTGRTIGSEKSLPEGITKKQSHYAQQLADRKDLIKEVVEEAVKIEDIPTRRAVFEKIRELKRKEREKEVATIKPIPKGQFDIIYADPPWRYEFSKDSKDQIEEHYPTMTLEEIKLKKVPAAKNSVLFLWATAPKLQEALEVMKAWGFQYRTNVVWDKQWIGMGYWFRGQHELLLVGTKGSFSPPPKEKRVSSVISVKRTKHSKKPSRVYEIIEAMFPDRKYYELFRTGKREGWEGWP